VSDIPLDRERLPLMFPGKAQYVNMALNHNELRFVSKLIYTRTPNPTWGVDLRQVYPSEDQARKQQRSTLDRLSIIQPKLFVIVSMLLAKL